MIKNSSREMENLKMKEAIKLTDSGQLQSVCKIRAINGQCPFLRMVNNSNQLICVYNTYVDIGLHQPNCGQ